MKLHISNGLLAYSGLYTLWAVGINIMDAKMDWRTTNWSKSTKSPFYWDNWSYTHIGWGIAAPFFGIKLPLFTLLNFLNEAVLEGLMCRLSEKGIVKIRFFGGCDPLPHAIADFLYSTLGYGIGYIIRLQK